MVSKKGNEQTTLMNKVLHINLSKLYIYYKQTGYVYHMLLKLARSCTNITNNIGGEGFPCKRPPVVLKSVKNAPCIMP